MANVERAWCVRRQHATADVAYWLACWMLFHHLIWPRGALLVCIFVLVCLLCYWLFRELVSPFISLGCTFKNFHSVLSCSSLLSFIGLVFPCLDCHSSYFIQILLEIFALSSSVWWIFLTLSITFLVSFLWLSGSCATVLYAWWGTFSTFLWNRRHYSSFTEHGIGCGWQEHSCNICIWYYVILCRVPYWNSRGGN